jgi:hypothetical protein
MENKKHYYKENIKDRMFKNAAGFWGIRNVENFDPLVKLLIEAMASEIYKLSNEVNNIETRILERIAHLLTPDILMSVRPAHMLLHAQPIEEQCIIHKETGFYYDDPIFKQKHKINETGFYPVDCFNLIKIRVKTLVCGRNVYTLDPLLNREIFTRSTVRTEVFSNTLWIGLEPDPKIETIKDLSFYFDFVNAENKNEYFHLLSFARWRHNSKLLKTTQGIHTIRDGLETGDMSLFSHYDLANLLDESIKRFYNHRFLTLKDELKVADMKKELFPEALLPFFSESMIQQLDVPLYWLQVTFPPEFDEEIMERILVGTNIFPVANKSLRSQTSKSLKLSNIIPLYTSYREHFLSVQSVVDTQNRQYKQLPFRDQATRQYGTYSVKRGGNERFDSRDAKEYIAYLIDLMRDEGASFSLLGKGFMENLIDNMDTLITTLEQRLNNVEHDREIPSYLIIDSESNDEIIYVNYWVSNCELVNDIKAGTFFSPYGETFVNLDSTISMTPCTGGKSRPNSNSALDMYKYILTGRDRIYTSEDIINFCYSEYGDMIALAEVKKGVRVSDKPKEGLIRTIDVFIDMKKQFDARASEDLRDNLLNLLMEKSPDTYNYRIFISNNNKESQ